MSLRTHHVSGNQECVSLAARGSDRYRGLPPFGLNGQGLSFSWAVWIDSTFPDDYGTLFTIGPDPFTNQDYMQAAIRKGQGNTGAADATWNLGWEGDHPPGVPTTLIQRSRWFYQGFRIRRDDSAPFGYNFVADYFYDLPDTTKKIDLTDFGGTALSWAYGASHSFRIGDNTWPTTAPNEALEGEFAGFKVWTAFLDVQSLIAEAFSPWPVMPQWFGALWDVIPLTTKYDTHSIGIRKQNGRPWTFPNVEPATGIRSPFQPRKIAYMPDLLSGFDVPAAGAAFLSRLGTLGAG